MNQLLKRLDDHFVHLRDKIALRDDITQPGLTDVDPALMREKLSKLLPYYMIPANYVKIDKIPMLPNGKLNKKALAAPDLTAYRADYAAPENETEQPLADGTRTGAACPSATAWRRSWRWPAAFMPSGKSGAYPRR